MSELVNCNYLLLMGPRGGGGGGGGGSLDPIDRSPLGHLIKFTYYSLSTSTILRESSVTAYDLSTPCLTRIA